MSFIHEYVALGAKRPLRSTEEFIKKDLRKRVRKIKFYDNNLDKNAIDKEKTSFKKKKNTIILCLLVYMYDFLVKLVLQFCGH